ncbi:MAG: hemolysin III family protein [Wenzhouxiangellaceae bacterium]|nr:hemolysin III family protein [Wenzhouxiangellaceae bacterium]
MTNQREIASAEGRDPVPASHREEIVNALTHGLGVLLGIGAGAVLITLAAVEAGAREIVSAAVYVGSLVVLYSASTLYHAIQHPRAKARLKVADHCAIFLLIAGTYTPFTIAALKGPWGWTLFGLVWGLAVIGILLKLFFTGRYAALSTAAYVGMGWLAIVAFVPLLQALSPWAMGWLITGGVLYTAGTWFYHNERIPHSHGIWHLFVLAGSVSHFIAVMAVLLS